MPFIIKYMIFSIIGVFVLAVIAAIYITIKDHRKNDD